MNKLISLVIGALFFATPVVAQIPGFSEIERFGFADILLWLLTFAIVYGVLSQAKLPASNAARAIIAIVLGFLVLLATPAPIITFIENFTSGLVLIVLGILVLLVFFELAGVKHVVARKTKTKEGEEVTEPVLLPFFSKHPYVLAVVFIIIASLLFVGAGGLDIIGLPSVPSINLTGLFFFVVIIIAVVWMLAESGKEK